VIKLFMRRTQGKLFIYKITTSNRRLIKQVKRRKTVSLIHYLAKLITTPIRLPSERISE